MFKKTLAMVTALVGFLNIKEIPIADGKVNFTEEQLKQLNEGYTPEMMQKTIDAINKEIAENPQIEKAQEQLRVLLQDYQTAEQEAANQEKNKVPDASEENADINAQIVQLKAQLEAKQKETDGLIKALMAEAEQDSPLQTLLNSQPKEMLKHSATHLFASGKNYDAFEGRNWNQLAIGKSTSATDWMAQDGINISKLNGDMELFFRENPDVINSLHRDNFGLPTHWKKRMNVVDRINSGSIATAELSQGRKLPWLPKNKQTIQPEEGYIYPISIDIEFVGHFLSEIEASWLAGYNKENSQAYKLTFVRFLVAELDKRARLEDRIASIKGVFVKTPDTATVAPSFMHRQNGLLYWIWKARDLDKKYRAFNVGVPTTSNIVDYIENIIKSLPIEVRTSQGLELAISPSWVKAYKKRIETLYGTNTNYTGYPEKEMAEYYPKNYPNIKFCELVDLEGSDFMFITYSNNIEILENVPKEKAMYTFEYLLRKIYVFADYKLGIRLQHIGNKVKEGDPAEFAVQTIWSNNVPIFSSDFFAPVYDDETGEIVTTFNQIKVDAGWKTNITKITGLAEGVILKIQGNVDLAATKNVINNATNVLTADFNLALGGTLTCLVLADGTLKELSRTAAPVTAPELTPVSYTTGSIDSNDGVEFVYGTTGALTITKILNGVPGQKVRIYGNAAAASNVTINDTTTIEVVSTAVLATATDYVDFVFVDGKWVEFKRVIA